MRAVVETVPPSEEEFAALVDSLAVDPNQQELIDLLREEHSFYNQRGTVTIVQMRGWVLLAIARTTLTDDALVFVLEELDTGVDPYLVAAAACALRSYPNPNPALARFVMRAVQQIRYHDDPVSFKEYGAYAVSSDATSPLRELFKTLAWLGPHAKEVLPEIEGVARSGGLSKKALVEAERALEAIRAADLSEPDSDCCSLPEGLLSKFSWSRKSRGASTPIASTLFEDQSGEQITFQEFFCARPSIVVFFYTRCDNPLKCSLTVAKLARVQKLLEQQGLAGQINTAAITYDPAFDLPNRIRNYGKDRDVSMSAGHRMLRAIDGLGALRRHFKLGVNFIESLVNRHRIEAYVLDREGRIAASFERLHWEEREVVDRAIEVLNEKDDEPIPASSAKRLSMSRAAGPVFGTLASLAVAFFPKCPICWAAYLSLFGVAGLIQIPYSPWLQPVFVTVMLINVFSVWLRARFTGRWWPLYLVSAGALLILISTMKLGAEAAAIPGIVMTLAGSLWNALNSARLRPSLAKRLQY
jgi:protein SCO1